MQRTVAAEYWLSHLEKEETRKIFEWLCRVEEVVLRAWRSPAEQ